jgi:hypothetical protein
MKQTEADIVTKVDLAVLEEQESQLRRTGHPLSYADGVASIFKRDPALAQEWREASFGKKTRVQPQGRVEKFVEEFLGVGTTVSEATGIVLRNPELHSEFRRRSFRRV